MQTRIFRVVDLTNPPNPLPPWEGPLQRENFEITEITLSQFKRSKIRCNCYHAECADDAFAQENRARSGVGYTLERHRIKPTDKRTYAFIGTLIASEQNYDTQYIDREPHQISITRKLYRMLDGKYLCKLERQGCRSRTLDEITIEIVADSSGIKEFFGDGKGTKWFYEQVAIEDLGD